GWWFRIGAFGQFQGLNNVPARICRHVCHALSIDETRSQFMPTLTVPPDPSKTPNSVQVIEQVWFRGGHAEVGGGYAEHELADLALHWMVKKAAADGLVVDRAKLPKLDAKKGAFAPIRTAVMRNPSWALFGTWPRWHPAERRENRDVVRAHHGTLDDSVWMRAEAASAAVQDALDRNQSPRLDDRAAADGLVFLEPNQSVTVAIRADRVWDRTGVVLERGGVYEIAPAGGHWRDKEGQHCEAGGDDLVGLDLFRRAGAWARRRPTDRYLALVGHVAHPRDWPVLEFGFFKLVSFFLFRDPRPLRASLIAIGERMKHKPGAPFRIALDCPSGVFYGFANDLWETYANNSGAVLITITRVPPGGDCDVTITERGEVKNGRTTSGAGDREWSRIDT
ncbi:MAG: DUF2235 domain-containing protein, partial [Alphaproteobacteria bacterium]|nr:DUF2235 domain-containing protein [Alphaproteobacteria bacterium]